MQGGGEDMLGLTFQDFSLSFKANQTCLIFTYSLELQSTFSVSYFLSRNMPCCSHIIFPATPLSISWLVGPSTRSCCCCSMLRRSSLLCCSMNSLSTWAGSPTKEPSRAVTRTRGSRVSHSCRVVGSSGACGNGSWERCWGWESSMLIAWTTTRSLSWSSLSSLQIANEPPACLVESSCYQSWVHGQSSNVEPSHPSHGVAPRLATSSRSL